MSTSIKVMCSNCGLISDVDYTLHTFKYVDSIVHTDKCCSKCGGTKYVPMKNNSTVSEDSTMTDDAKPETEHPIFGSDTPKSIREDIDKILDEIQVDPGQIKGAVVNVGTRILAAVASIPDEDINNLVAGYKALTKSYGEVIIAIMPFIDKACKVVTELEKDFKKS